MTTPRFRNGRIATDHELECIAKAFGFSSALAMEKTLRGMAPSALGEHRPVRTLRVA